MAVVKFFRDRPIKRMHRVEGGIKLIFYASHRGGRGPQQIVSQADWDAFGRKEFVPDESATADKLRELAAQTE